MMDGSDADRTRMRGRRMAKDEAVVKDAARYKTVLCQKWLTHGSCPYNNKCQFAHGDAELRKRTVPYTPPPRLPPTAAHPGWGAHHTVCVPVYVPVATPCVPLAAPAIAARPPLPRARPRQAPQPPPPQPAPTSAAAREEESTQPSRQPPVAALWSGGAATWHPSELATDWRPDGENSARAANTRRAEPAAAPAAEPPWIMGRAGVADRLSEASFGLSFGGVRRQISLLLRDDETADQTLGHADEDGETGDTDATPPTPTRRASGSFGRTPSTPIRKAGRHGPPPVRRHQRRPSATRVGLDLGASPVTDLSAASQSESQSSEASSQY